MTSRVLLVAGAVSYDYLVYPPMTATDEVDTRSPRNYENGDAAQLVIRASAADLVAKLLTAQKGFEVLGPQLQAPPANCLNHNASSIVDLRSDETSSPERQTYSVVRLRHLGSTPLWHSPPIDKAIAAQGATVIITGSGEAFRRVEPALDFLQKTRPRYIVHHMTRPLAVGPIWDLIRDGPRTRDGVPELDFLAVIIDADDLRAEGIALSESLSWEATAEDFVRNLGSNGLLDTLVTCPNLIVRFGTEGVIHHRGRDAVDPKLYYHPRKMEHDQLLSQHNQMIGLAPAFTAGFALGFADSRPPNGEKGIRLGISAARGLSETGFVQNSIDNSPDYPVEIMNNLAPDTKYGVVSIPSSKISSGERFSIFNEVTGDPAEVARQIVTVGPEKALAKCPTQRFKDLLVFERSEQESLRAIVGAVRERLESSKKQPTSIGVFGPAGAGKKFIASNISQFISSGPTVQKLTFNARLLKSDELIAACHSIRDSTARGALTIVVFENFEAVLEASNNNLLNEFLVIMRDGKFADRGHFCSLGAPLMFFLVNQDGNSTMGSPRPTTPTHMGMMPVATEFGAGPTTRSIDDSILLDYLHGVVRVAGPNQSSPQDKLYPVRRAIMLRHLLQQRHPHLEVYGTMKVEEGVLHALLLVPSYKHGLRSLEKIISTSRLSGRKKFDVSALPPEEQIQIYVDGKIFMSYLRSPKLPPALRERLAEGLFETYKKRRVVMVKNEEERQALLSDRSMRDWEDLAPELKESTRAQADDIPRKLRAVNCFMLEADRTEPLIRVPQFSESDLDLLSEMEHERFNAERLQRQWRMGPRNSKQRTTPFLVPWRDLEEEWREVDRVMVECVPRILDKAGWKIYKMQEEA